MPLWKVHTSRGNLELARARKLSFLTNIERRARAGLSLLACPPLGPFGLKQAAPSLSLRRRESSEQRFGLWSREPHQYKISFAGPSLLAAKPRGTERLARSPANSRQASLRAESGDAFGKRKGPRTAALILEPDQFSTCLDYMGAKDLKKIYQADRKEQAEAALLEVEETWGAKYPHIFKSWTENWETLSIFFDFPSEIRKMIYTTNVIENVNRVIRKYTKGKTIFPSDQAVTKSVYLALQRLSEKWTMPLRNWQKIIAQLAILYPDKIKLDI